MPMFTPDIFQAIIRSFLNDCTDVSWQLLSDGKMDSDAIILLTRMCQEITDTLTILILEVTLPQVNKWMDWVEEENHRNACIPASFPTVYTQRTRTYDRVTEDDVEASFGNCLDCCFGMALGLPQSKTEQSQALLALFIVSITKRVNSGLQELTQPSSSNSSSESVSSTDSQTEDIVYLIAHILRACMRNDKGLPSPQFSRRSCTFSDDETDIRKIMEAADQLLALTDIEERSATPAGKPPQKSLEEEAEDDEELKIVLDFLASERENEASVKPENLPQKSLEEEAEDDEELKIVLDFLASERENEASVKPESPPKRSAKEEEEQRLYLETAAEFFPSENEASMKPEKLPKTSAEQKEENGRIINATLEFLASEGENYSSIERENLPQKSAEKLERKAMHYSSVNISPLEFIQYYDISGKKSEVSLFSSLVFKASDSFGEPLKSEEGLGSECTSLSSSLVNETSNSYNEELPQQRRKVLRKAKKAKKGKKKADYSSTETSDGGTQQRYDERYQDEKEDFCSEEELLIKQHRTCLTVFLVKLLDHIAPPNQPIYHTDFVGMVERLRMKTDTIRFATLLRTSENLHIPVYKDLVEQFGSAEEIQSAVRYKRAIFEKAVSTALNKNLWKCSEKTRSSAVKRKTKKRVKQFSTDSEMNTSSMSEEFDWVVGSTPLPQKKNKKKCILCHMIDSVTKFFRKVFK
ncbi:uncharacterized protein LOC117562717 [Gymnodraco acuticeps]|uniref:Uncharacterized protein LOC117562717 n=1 Tax=Gymnodraco acuticeps TaxID=8218 RepID=A0A6P8WGE6_GYMAC|nr:uncharacterized protein LOC117562717 [Gymnodraco acuticeps]